MPRPRRTSLRSRIPEPELNLRLTGKFPRQAAGQIKLLRPGLPVLIGRPISVSVQPDLTAAVGKLLSGKPGRGTPVHAASFIRKREIILETALARNPDLFRLILVHELFHFAWVRLSNDARRQYDSLLHRERNLHARGDLGESASAKKLLCNCGSRAWRDYVCESFCDTAAWLYAGVTESRDFSLSSRHRTRRADWFHNAGQEPFRC